MNIPIEIIVVLLTTSLACIGYLIVHVPKWIQNHKEKQKLKIIANFVPGKQDIIKIFNNSEFSVTILDVTTKPEANIVFFNSYEYLPITLETKNDFSLPYSKTNFSIPKFDLKLKVQYKNKSEEVIKQITL
jgi:hypothetical protein